MHASLSTTYWVEFGKGRRHCWCERYGCVMMSALPLIDVNQLTVGETWPLLTSAISSAHFIAIDLELSGLGRDRTKSAIDSGERYKLQCDVASSYGILSMGVACFQWQQPSPSASTNLRTCCKVEAFNIWPLSQRSYTIDPSSAKFLLEHGFDFNKQLRHGLPYTPVHTIQQGHSAKLCEGSGALPTLFALILLSGCPLVVHNGLTDLLFLYSHLYAPLPSRLDVFMADLSEMFSGGVYDTKAIADFHLHEEASFLEYIFRKKQRHDLLAAGGNAVPHLELIFADYADLESCVECVPLLPPPLPPMQQLLQIKLCHSFTSFGHCPRHDCELNHDVLVSIALKEHELELLKAKRMRKKELQTQRKKRKLLNVKGESTDLTQLSDKQQKEEDERGGTKFNNVESSESEFEKGIEMDVQLGGDREFAESAMPELLEDGGMVDRAEEKGEEGVWPETTTKGLREQFECELSAAKKKFSQHQSGSGGGDILKLKPSFGHRAGFDAFMTGYSFASIAVSLYHKARENRACRSAKGEEEGERRLQDMLAGELGKMRNKLANRKNKFPVHILKSHFTCTSQQHKTAQINIREKFNKHTTNHHEH